jgi:predicted transposase/invertase (TIGR01784 family)
MEQKNGVQDMKARYEESLKIYRDLKGVVDTSYDEGMEEGKKVGIEEGKKVGIEETAKNMLNDGLPPETISKYTSLPVEEIKKLF